MIFLFKMFYPWQILLLHEKKIIHRDIKPYNIFIKEIPEEKDLDDYTGNDCIIKFANFGSVIEIDKNDNIQIGTILYTATEILKNLKCDEKCDMWSLYVNLYYLYFGNTPYTTKYDINSIMDKIYSNNFIYIFSDIPTLEILFKKLMVINPEERMTHEKFYEYVNSKEFMQPDTKYKENIYRNIQKEIENIKKTEEYNELIKETKYIPEEGESDEEKIKKQISKINKIISIPNILDLFESLYKDQLFVKE